MAHGASCWLCGARMDPPASDGARKATQARAAAPQHLGYSFSLSTMLLITTLFAICCGLIASYPGLGVIVAILLAPVIVRTARVVRRREAAGATVSTAEKLALGATSFAAAAVIAAVVGCAAFCCLCATCATLFGLGSGNSEVVMIAFVAAALAAASVALSAKLIKWSRRRYARDIQVPSGHDG